MTTRKQISLPQSRPAAKPGDDLPLVLKILAVVGFTIGVIIALILAVAVVGALTGAFAYLAIYAWQAVVDLLSAS